MVALPGLDLLHLVRYGGQCVLFIREGQVVTRLSINRIELRD